MNELFIGQEVQCLDEDLSYFTIYNNYRIIYIEYSSSDGEPLYIYLLDDDQEEFDYHIDTFNRCFSNIPTSKKKKENSYKAFVSKHLPRR